MNIGWRTWTHVPAGRLLSEPVPVGVLGRGPCPWDAFHLPGLRPVLRFPPAAAAGALLSPEGALSGCREGPRERGPGWWSQLCHPFPFGLHGGGARLCLPQRIGGRGSRRLPSSLIIQLLLLNGLKILDFEPGVIIITFFFCFLSVLLCFYPSKAWLNLLTHWPWPPNCGALRVQ